MGKAAAATGVLAIWAVALISAPAGAASGPGPQIFTHEGKEQTYTVPSGITYIQVTAVGAPGAAGAASGGSGGKGAQVSGLVPVTPGQALYVEVGGPGTAPGSHASAFNGGGSGNPGPSIAGGGGGGASDVRTCSMSSSNCQSTGGTLGSRLLVAGGGGGGGGGVYSTGGAGGAQGGNGQTGGGGSQAGAGGQGATVQAAGAGGANAGGCGGPSGSTGASGAGGAGGTGYYGGGGGGGGGYYGAGGGGGTCVPFGAGGGGGGGSSFGQGPITVAQDTTGTPLITITPLLAGSATSFSYRGGEQTYTVPAGYSFLGVTATGAPGGAGAFVEGLPPSGAGADGARVTGVARVNPGQTLYVEIGGAGSQAGVNGGGQGGWNGGGTGGAEHNDSGASGGGGGGASDVRTCSMSATSCPGGAGSLGSRLLVAGGGGGGGGDAEANFTTASGGDGGGSGAGASANGVTGAGGGGGIDGGGGGLGATQAQAGAGGQIQPQGPACQGGGGDYGSSGSGGMGGTVLVGGGGGGGGYFGGGGGAGGCYPQTANSIGGGGGGGGGSSLAPGAPTLAQDTTGTPSVTVTPLAPAAPQGVRRTTVSHIKLRSDGLITFKLSVAGRGSVNVLVTGARSRGSRRRVTFARKQLKFNRARTLGGVVRPGPRGLRLLRHGDLGAVTLWITYKPRHGRSYTVVRKRLRVPRR